AAWTQVETESIPRPMELPPPAGGAFWARAGGPGRVALVFDVPGPAEPNAAARAVALECLVGSGVGGRLERELRDTFDIPLAFAVRESAGGLRQRVELRCEAPPEVVPELFA